MIRSLFLKGLLLGGVMMIATPHAAHAADANGKFAIRGAGVVQCASFANATPEQRLFAETWWAGYLTAINRTTSDTYNVIGEHSVEEVNAWLENYCQENPGDSYAIADHKMLEAFFPERQRSGD